MFYFTATFLAALAIGMFQAQAAEQPTLLEAATFVMMADRENAVGTVSETSDPCVFQVRRKAENGSAPFKQIDFRRLQSVRVEIPAGRQSTQRLTLSGDPGAYCQGVLSPEDAERHAIAKRSGGRGCSNEMIVWSGDSQVPLERVARAALYISRNFCPFSGQPY